MLRLAPLLLLCVICFGCGADLPPGAQRFILRDRLKTTETTAYQAYWSLADTASWERTVAAADTTYRSERFWKFRSNKIWYEVLIDDKGNLRTEQHYPGWERQIDSVSVMESIVYSSKWNRLLADIPVADVVLGGDSIRIGVVRVKDKVFPWQSFGIDEPDYLALFPPGEDSVPISLNLSSIGPITSQTIFRVGRKTYALTYLSEDRRELVVEPYSGARGPALAAEIDLIYRATPVKDSIGLPTQIKRSEGKELYLFFTGPHNGDKRVLQKLDSTYQSLPATVKERTEVAVVLRHFSFLHQSDYVRKLNISLPVYLTDERTCKQLVCRANLPYYLHVNERGRVTTFWGMPDRLAEIWSTDQTSLMSSK